MVISACLANLFAMPTVQVGLAIPPCHCDLRLFRKLICSAYCSSYLGYSSLRMPAMVISAFLAHWFAVSIVQAVFAGPSCHGDYRFVCGNLFVVRIVGGISAIPLCHFSHGD